MLTSHCLSNKTCDWKLSIDVKLANKTHEFTHKHLFNLEYNDEKYHSAIMVIMRKGPTYGGSLPLKHLSRLLFVNERVKIWEKPHT